MNIKLSRIVFTPAAIAIGLGALSIANAGFKVDSSLVREYKAKQLAAQQKAQAQETAVQQLTTAVIAWAEARKRLDSLALEAEVLIQKIEQLKAEVAPSKMSGEDVEAFNTQSASLIERVKQAQSEVVQKEQIVEAERVHVSEVKGEPAPKPVSTTADPVIPVTLKTALAKLEVATSEPPGLQRVSKTAWNTKTQFALPQSFLTRQEFFKKVLPIGYSAYYLGHGNRFDGVYVNDSRARTWEEWLAWAAEQTKSKMYLDYRIARVTYKGVAMPTTVAGSR